MKTTNSIRRSLAISSLIFVPAMEAVSRADTVVVTPSNMNGWTLNSFDDNGNIVNTGPYYGTAAMAEGPATPPLGTGSAHLATPVGAGDGAAAIATEQFDGTLLSSITALSYASYDVTNNGQQFPYLAISIDTNDANNDLDTLFFEPPYQEPSTGNPSLPDQGATVQDVWQTWNAFVGGYWDNGIGDPHNPTTVGTPGTGVEPLSAFLEAYPNAMIEDGGAPGLGGIALQVGFGSSGETEDGYVDDFTIGVNGVDTSYDFEVPEPASTGLLIVGGAAALMRRRRRASA
jgi:hypothetical protein